MKTVSREVDDGAQKEILLVQSLLNIAEAPEDDLQYFLERRMEGSA